MMTGPAQLDALYESTIKPRLDALESLRLELKAYIGKAIVLVGIPVAVFLFSDVIALTLPHGASFVLSTLGLLGVFGAVAFAGLRYAIPGFTAYANYNVRFKREVVAEVFRAICPAATYTPQAGVTKAVFDAAGIFSTKGVFRSDDLVRGTIGQTPFEASEVERQYSTGDKNRSTVDVFHGLFFHLDFNKSLNGVTIVQPESARPSQLGDRDTLTKVMLENPTFEQEFVVWASNEVEARYILTPAMMERLLTLKARAGRPVFLGFKERSAYIGVDYGHPLFEPGLEDTTSKRAIMQMAEHFDLAAFVVQELDLNTRIWTKGVDTSLLEQAPAEPNALLSLAQARDGALTAQELWKTATAAIGAGIDSGRADQPVPRPPGVRVGIDEDAGRTTFSYGFTGVFFVSFALWLATVLVEVSALRGVARTMGPGPVSPLVRVMPPIPLLDPLTADHALGWLLGAAVVGGVVSLGWMLHVRKVVVGPDAVRIYRGLRPVARVYARETYGRAVRVGNAVFLAKTDASGLINPTASPSLRPDEAQWLAYEMGRALAKTSR